MTVGKLNACGVVLALALIACGDGGAADTTVTPGMTDTTGLPTVAIETITEGILTICTDSPNPPMQFEEEGEPTGFDIELVRSIASNLGLDLEVVNTGFDPIESGLAMEEGDCDLAAASITITPERAENIAFTDGYLSVAQSLLVATDSDLTGLSDLAGHSIAVQAGTSGESYAQDNAPEDTELISFEEQGDVFSAFETGEVDGVLHDFVANAGYARDSDSVIVAETYATGRQYGFAAGLQGTETLISTINAQLEAVRADGTYDAIYDEFFPQG